MFSRFSYYKPKTDINASGHDQFGPQKNGWQDFFDVTLRRITAATHVCELCMRYCNRKTAHILLHYVMEFHLEITKAKERTDNIFILVYFPITPRIT